VLGGGYQAVIQTIYPNPEWPASVDQPLAFFESVEVAKKAYAMLTLNKFCKIDKVGIHLVFLQTQHSSFQIDFACPSHLTSLYQQLSLSTSFSHPEIVWSQRGWVQLFYLTPQFITP
jgi:hypothetical protein